MKNANREAPFFRFPAMEQMAHCSTLLSAFFKNPKNGGIDMPSALHGSSRLPNGNIVLTIKSKDDATRAHVHADDWVKLINECAITPHSTFAVVTNNASAAIWMDQTQVGAAIHEIKQANGNVSTLDLDITNLSWLNSKEAHVKSGRGPLMISFKTKAATNAAIDQNLTLCDITCSVNIYVPQPPQCFRCQDWGHRVMECSWGDRCSRCGGPHVTSQHTCLHDNPCPTDQCCNKAPPKCANCSGDHPSWVHSCPAAKTTLAAQACCPAYRSGRYESLTPFTFTDILHTGPRAPDSIDHQWLAPVPAPTLPRPHLHPSHRHLTSMS